MGILETLFGGKGGGIVGAVGNVIDDLHTSDDEKAQAKLAVQRLMLERQELVEQSLRTELEARKEIMVAELQQGDTFTKRARPMIVYVGLAIMAFNYAIAPWIARLAGADLPPVQFPEAFWMAWGGVVGVYAIGRSAEKRGNSSKLTRMITGSGL